MENICCRKLFVVLGDSLCMGLGTTLVQGAEGAATAASISSLASGAVKWHPGHYAAIDQKQKNKSAYLKGLYADLDANPALRGVLLRFAWSELEPTKGNYDFSAKENI